MESDRISGIVLAGGRSTRFGRDKLAARLGDGTLLDRAVAALAAMCTDVTLVIAQDGPEPAMPGRPGAPLRIVRDAEPDRGPVQGLAAGLEAAPNPVVLVVGGDMPSLVAPVLRLLAAEVAAGASAAVLEESGRRRPLPAAFERARGLVAAREALGRGRGSLASLAAVLDALDAVVVPEAAWRPEDPGGESLRDVDRPEDLERLR